MADENTEIQEQETQETTPQQLSIQFEDILPWGTTGGDTGLSSRLKLKRNFEKIKAWIDSLSSSQILDHKYLSKEHADTAAEVITFAKGLISILSAYFGDYQRTAAHGGNAEEDSGAAIHPNGTGDFIDLVIRGLVRGNLNVEQALNAAVVNFMGILKSNGATDGFNGNGIYMTAEDGKRQTDALEVRGWARFAKLVYNMIQIMEQDYQFSGGGDIEDVIDNHDGTWTLKIHKEKEGRHTSFADFDILYGKVDDLQESGGSYMYYASYMRTCENGVTLNEGMTPDEVRVELWDDNMVPGGRNFPPRKMMTVAKRGNTQDPERQSFWELSTTDHRITHYWHVDQPKLRADNYALCLGILPTILDDAGVLPSTRDPKMPSLYVNTIFYEHDHHIYYPSRVVKEDRGEWSATPTAKYTGIDGRYQNVDYIQGQTISEPYHFESFSRNMWLTYRLSPAHASMTDVELLAKMRQEWHVDLETSRVWRYCALWECLVEGTAQAPQLGCSDWTLIQQPAIVLQITATKRLLRTRDFKPTGTVGTTLGFQLQFGGYDMTADILRSEAVWTRQSVGADSDQALAAADAAWNNQHRYGDLTIGITENDLPSNWATAKEVQFTLTITKNGSPVGQPRSITIH